MEDHLVGFVPFQNLSGDTEDWQLPLAYSCGNKWQFDYIFISAIKPVWAFFFFFFIKKQLISVLVTFYPTPKGSKLKDVSILAPENLRWRCLCWGEDVQNNVCFKPAVPLCHQHWPLLTFSGLKAITVIILAGFSGENIHLDDETFSWTLWMGDSSGLCFITFTVSKRESFGQSTSFWVDWVWFSEAWALSDKLLWILLSSLSHMIWCARS